MADKNMPENNKSDILVILENIDQMLQCFTKMVNGYARNIQEVAIAVEAMTLAQKLRLAACRWQYWLPFKEACDVNFNWWEKRMEYWCDFVNGCEDKKKNYDDIQKFTPKTEFFIDQYFYRMWLTRQDKIVERKASFSPFFRTKDAEKFSNKIFHYTIDIDCYFKSVKDEIDKNAVVSLFLSDMNNNMFSLEELKAMRTDMDGDNEEFFEWIENSSYISEESYTTESALYNLYQALSFSNEVLVCSDDSAFKDLYERLSVAYFNELIKEAKDDFQKWLNSTPKKKRLDMMKKKLEKEKNKFFSGKWKEGLENYFDIDNIESVLEGTDAGKFLFRYRNDLSLEEAGKIIAQYHKIACFHSEIRKLENKEKDVTPEAVEKPAQEEKVIELPVIFNSIIRDDAKATNMLVDAIRKLALTTGHKSKTISGGKTWGHVKESLVIHDYIDKDCSGADFGRAIEAICSDKTHSSVEQSLKRYNSKMLDEKHDKTSDNNIISDIGKMMNPLNCYLVTRYPQKFPKY